MADLKLAHKHSSRHRVEVEASESCGCFYCLESFPPSEIREWVDANGTTAICPRCGVDSVIGSRSGFLGDPGFLESMRSKWFNLEEAMRITLSKGTS